MRRDPLYGQCRSPNLICSKFSYQYKFPLLFSLQNIRNVANFQILTVFKLGFFLLSHKDKLHNLQHMFSTGRINTAYISSCRRSRPTYQSHVQGSSSSGPLTIEDGTDTLCRNVRK